MQLEGGVTASRLDERIAAPKAQTQSGAETAATKAIAKRAIRVGTTVGSEATILVLEKASALHVISAGRYTKGGDEFRLRMANQSRLAGDEAFACSARRKGKRSEDREERAFHKWNVVRQGWPGRVSATPEASISVI